MSIIKTEYLADNGIAAFSYQGYQKFNSISEGKFYYASPLHTDITAINKWTIDSCWETGDLFYINGNTVYKTKYDGTLIASLVLTNPVSISVIQPTFNVLSVEYGTDLGCWIVDETDKLLIKTDTNLNIVKTVINLSNPVRVVTSSDRGCFVLDDTLQWIMKFNSSMEMESFIDYSSVGSVSVNDFISLESTIDSGLCILSKNTVYVIKCINGGIGVSNVFTPIDYLSLVGGVSDIGLQKVNNILYAVGCSTIGSWIAAFNISSTISLVESGLFSSGFAKTVEVSQYSNAEDVYVVIEEDLSLLPPECETSSSSESSSSNSSSSSSSSSGGGSSSSSSSIDSSSSSSSQSSSSSSSLSSSSSSVDSSSSSSSSSGILGPYFGSGFGCPADGYFIYLGQNFSNPAYGVYLSQDHGAILTYDSDWGVSTWKVYVNATYYTSAGNIVVVKDPFYPFWDFKKTPNSTIPEGGIYMVGGGSSVTWHPCCTVPGVITKTY